MDIKAVTTTEYKTVCEFGFTRTEVDDLLHALDCALNEGQLGVSLFFLMDVLGAVQKRTGGKE